MDHTNCLQVAIKTLQFKERDRSDPRRGERMEQVAQTSMELVDEEIQIVNEGIVFSANSLP
jgi:hypothetical protein